MTSLKSLANYFKIHEWWRSSFNTNTLIWHLFFFIWAGMSPIPMQGLSIFRISSEVWLNLHQEELVHQQHIMEFLITAHWKYGDLKHLYKWVINLQDSLLKCIILEVILVTLDLRVIFILWWNWKQCFHIDITYCDDIVNILWWNWNCKLKGYFYIVIKLKTQHIPHHSQRLLSSCPQEMRRCWEWGWTYIQPAKFYAYRYL